MDVHVHKTYGYWMLLLQTDVLQHSASMEQEVQRQWGTPELHCVVKKVRIQTKTHNYPLSEHAYKRLRSCDEVCN